MKKWNWITATVLSIVTCSWYNIYFYWKLGENARKINEQTDKKIINYWLCMLITLLTFGLGAVSFFVYYYQLFVVMDEEAKRLGITKFYSPVASMFIMLVPVYRVYYVCDYQNTLAKAKGILTED